MFADMAILSSPRAATTSSSSLGSASSTSPKKQQHQQPPNHFPTPTSSEILSAVYPFFHNTLQLQQLVLTTTLQLLLNILIASRAIIFRALTTSRLVVLTTAQLIWRAWDSKQSRRFRKRLEFELFVLLLGPLGNMMFLMLFWPGWVMLALGLWAWWK